MPLMPMGPTRLMWPISLARLTRPMTRADEANKTTDATGANEADVVNKPDKADKAKAKETNKAL